MKPTFKDTALYRFPVWAFDKAAGRFLAKPSTENEDAEEEEVASSSDDVAEYEVLEKAKTSAQNGNGKAVKRSKKSARGR